MSDSITLDDMNAPEGHYRIIREEMSDGQLSIVADFRNHRLGLIALGALRRDIPEDVFTLRDDTGKCIEPDGADVSREDIDEMSSWESNYRAGIAADRLGEAKD